MNKEPVADGIKHASLIVHHCSVCALRTLRLILTYDLQSSTPLDENKPWIMLKLTKLSRLFIHLQINAHLRTNTQFMWSSVCTLHSFIIIFSSEQFDEVKKRCHLRKTSKTNWANNNRKSVYRDGLSISHPTDNVSFQGRVGEEIACNFWTATRASVEKEFLQVVRDLQAINCNS